MVDSMKSVCEAQFGDHNCVVYNSGDDLTRLLSRYFKYGLDNNHFCIWVTRGEKAQDEARSALGYLLPDYKKSSIADQVEFIDCSDFYLSDGLFSPDLVLDQWQSRLEWAISNGFSGIRASGDLGWFEKKDWPVLMDYERRLDPIVRPGKISALCSYPLHKLSAPGILDVIHRHRLAITKTNGEWQYFEPLGEGFAMDDTQSIPGMIESGNQGGGESPKPVVYPERCDGCGLCIEVCRKGVLYLADNRIAIKDNAECDWCTDCEAVCPSEAISCPFEITSVSG